MGDEYDVYYPDPAIDLLSNLNDTERSIKSKIDELKTSEPSKLGQPLKDELSGLRSVRAGDYRVVYGVFEDEGVIYIYGASLRREGDRDDVYEEVIRRYSFE